MPISQESPAIVKQVRTQLVITQASLSCLAEDVFRAGNKSLYEDIRGLSKALDANIKMLLEKHGADTPEKKVTLRVV